MLRGWRCLALGRFGCLALLGTQAAFLTGGERLLAAHLGQFGTCLAGLGLGLSRYAAVLGGRLGRGQGGTLHHLHLAQGGLRVAGDRADVDAHFATDRVDLAVRAALIGVARRPGVGATDGGMRLLVAAHLAVAAGQAGDLLLFLAQLLGLGCRAFGSQARGLVILCAQRCLAVGGLGGGGRRLVGADQVGRRRPGGVTGQKGPGRQGRRQGRDMGHGAADLHASPPHSRRGVRLASR
ncbi:hypothetical protein PSEUDO8AS_10704 [Pseudomonas sp. 8AS]|nr:hypothetical protein PSEUDO8AS_10704 [Pseudomonas sp. 8AS]